MSDAQPSRYLRLSSLLAASLLLGALVGCNGEKTTLPRCGDGKLEGREICDDGNLEPGDGCDPNCNLEQEQCGNGEDDDGDGSADCADPDCFSDPLCTGSEVCANGFDDDGDGLVDCNDPDCETHELCRNPEVCDNNLDDDGDGLIDCEDTTCGGHPHCGGCDPAFDFGTLNPGAEVEASVPIGQAALGTTPTCAAGPTGGHVRFLVEGPFHLLLDTDSTESGYVVALLREEEPGITCETDEQFCLELTGPSSLQLTQLPPGGYRVVAAEATTGASALVDVKLSIITGTAELCDNGADDDGDGLVDCDDDQCSTDINCLVEICDNGIDDDLDNEIDCADPDCATAPPCLPPELCANGVDDDLDGRADCADFDCTGGPGCTGSACVVNYDLGRLGRGDSVLTAFDASIDGDSVDVSCGFQGQDLVFAFSLDATANVVVDMTQNGDHVLALATEAGTGSWCDTAEIDCHDPGGANRPARVNYVGLPPARYFLMVDSGSAPAGGTGTLRLEIFDPTIELCTGGADDDSDGLIDCDDPDCASRPECGPELLCHDGLDNDSDLLVDCADFDCSGTPACGPGACTPDRDLGVISPGRPGFAAVSTASASDLYGASCARSGGGGDVVLSFTLTEPGDLFIQASQPNFSDHVVALMGQAGPGSQCDDAENMCTDAGAPGLPIAATARGATPGTYYLLIEPYGPGGEGDLNLQINVQAPP